MRGLFGLGMMAALAASANVAVAAGDPAQGRAAAQRWCSSCHAVGAAGGGDTAPPFAAIARIRSDEYLRGFLTRPHPPMPPLELSRQDIDDIVAYFATVRQ